MKNALLFPIVSALLLAAAAEPSAAAEGAATDKGRAKLQVSNSLRPAALVLATLQPARGLASAARGLTPTEEWLRAFPRKKQP
jgi:hypothetical protein